MRQAGNGTSAGKRVANPMAGALTQFVDVELGLQIKLQG